MTNETEQHPPISSLDSERQLLCAALTPGRETLVTELASVLSPDDFCDEAHQNIWRLRTALDDAGVSHDLHSIAASARRSNAFIGGADYLVRLVNTDWLLAASDDAIRAAAKRVHDLAVLRAFTATMESAVALAYTGQGDTQSIVSMVADTAESIRNAANTRAVTAIPIEHYVSAALEQIDQRANGAQPDNVTPTRFEGLNRIITGLGEQDLIVLAARPSMGKTAISLALAEHAASPTEHGRDVLYFSTEQSGNALTYRMLGSASRVNVTKLKNGDLSSDDFSRLVEGAERIGNLRLEIDETSELTLPDLRARARAFARKVRARGGKPMLVVDYLQRMTAHRSADPRLIYGEITTGLKNLAKELKAPVIVLAQLNREVEKRTNKRPMMSDLAESGKIEQDADIIIFLYRDEYYYPETREPGITEVIVVKNRDGAIGFTKLLYDKATQRYDDIG